MEKRIVSNKMVLENLPPLTPDQKAELEALQDREIDLSDVPELDADRFAKAVRNPYSRRPAI